MSKPSYATDHISGSKMPITLLQMTIKLQHYARAMQSILLQAGISKDKVIPLYGRGNTDGKDPR